MITANNGILLVVMLFAYGMRIGNDHLIAASFILAAASYVVNALNDCYGMGRGATNLALLVIGFGTMVLAYALKLLIV